MANNTPLTPTRPYLTRATYDWIVDNHLTPYILVDATLPHVKVPEQHIRDGQIVLNALPTAVHNFRIELDAISFSARFGGVPFAIYIPMPALLGIYARENGQGLFFDLDEYAQQPEANPVTDSSTPGSAVAEPVTPTKKPSLRLLDE